MYSSVYVDVASVVLEDLVEVVLPLFAIGGSACARIGACTSSLYGSVVDIPLFGSQYVMNDGSSVPSPFRIQGTEMKPCKRST